MTIVVQIGIGPVQQFIGEARRARDWWAGSFLLAWLAGRAMQAVVAPPGGIAPYGRNLRPDPSVDLMWRAMQGGCSDWPTGTLPNRFTAELDDLDRFVADDPCRKVVDDSFAALARAVKERFVDGIDWDAHGLLGQAALTEVIWQRQIEGYFEVNWVAGASDGAAEDAFWLDRRKLCRDHPRAIEWGDHCRMMGDLQELSGRYGRDGRPRQPIFWNAVRERIKARLYGQAKPNEIDYPLLELAKSERLCAIALVKRLFPLLPRETLERVIGWAPYGAVAARTQPAAPGAVRSWPSTATVAASPWRRRAWRQAEQACRRFAETAARLMPDEVAREAPRLAGHGAMELFGRIEGASLFRDALDARIAAERAQGHDEAVERMLVERLSKLKSALADLQGTVTPRASESRSGGCREASPYLAILVMDGDKTGELVRNHRDAPRALQRFATVVAGSVGADGRALPGMIEKDHQGILVYAGGDDVQALVPLDEALPAVLALREAYMQAFAAEFGPAAHELAPPPTISAALLIVDHGEPLGGVIDAAHALLEERAKRKNERNSLALRILKPSGATIDLLAGFPLPGSSGVPTPAPFEAIVELARQFFARPADHPSRFVYKTRQRWRDLLEETTPLTSDQQNRLLMSEWLKGKREASSQVEEERRLAEADAIIRLIAASMTCRRGDGGSQEHQGLTSFMAGPLIARFLADRGVGFTDPGDVP